MKKKALSLVLALSVAMSLMIPSTLAYSSYLNIDVGETSISVGDTTRAQIASDIDEFDEIKWSINYRGSTGDATLSSFEIKNAVCDICGTSPGTVNITATAYADGEAVASDNVLIEVKGSTSGSVYISSDLPSSKTVTYGESNTISFTAYNTGYGSIYYQWEVDGDTDSSSSSNSFNTRYLSVGSHRIRCFAYTDGAAGEYTGYCTVNVTNDQAFDITTDLPSSKTVTYGDSNSISFVLKNTTGYSTNYQWYVDGSKNNSYSSNETFNTKNLPVGTHKVYCNVYTTRGSFSLETRTCTITVNENKVVPTPTTGSMNNFYSRNPYNNRFTDVYTNNWFYSYVKTAYEYGLVNGKNSATTYCPFDNFTVAEALKIAACINSIYYTKSETALTNGSSTPYWYSIYVNYCISNGIINQGDFYDYNANCTRAQMAYIFSRCLPNSELSALRDVNIPDCNNAQTTYYSNIQTLYNAGIISGDATHCYYPNNLIKRSEVAKIVCTLTAPSTRDRTVF